MTIARTINVLLVEDDLNDAELASRMLKRSGLDATCHRVDTEGGFRKELAEFRPDVILSDFSMPMFDGMSALAIARQMAPDTPFIFVSGTIGEEYAIRALKNGATDYVLKGHMARLAPAIERALEDVQLAAEQERVSQALQHSELRFRLAASTGDLWDWSVVSGEAYLSRQWKERLGYQDHEVRNTLEAWMDLMHPDDRDLVKHALNAHLMSHLPYDVEFRARSRDGEYRWSHAKGQAMWNEQGVATYMAGSVVDITERKHAELKVRRLNRLYAVLSGINSVVVRVATREDLFRESCRIAIETGQFMLAWIGLVPADRRGLELVAWDGAGAAYMAQLPLSLEPDAADFNVLAHQALTEQRTVMVEDITVEPRLQNRQRALSTGLRSKAILPLVVGGSSVGALAIYAGEAGFFDDTEIELLRELANDIAFAMDYLEKADRLNYLAYYDALTGLANASLLHDRLKQALDAAHRDGHRLALLNINIDRFKQINDSLGRAAGDQLLKQVALRLQNQAETLGWQARIDADHFAIVCSDYRSEEELARRVQSLLRDCFAPAFQIAGTELRIAARIGIALFPSDGDEVEALMRHAEAACMKARARGESYLFYTQEMSDKIAGALALETRLRRALLNNEFVLYYQPKVDAETRAIIGLEALIRWQDPEQGLVSPGLFIPLLEETALIVEVGTWALRQAVSDHAHLLGLGLPETPRIAVNVSPIQLRRADFADRVRNAIADGPAATGIDLEITESVVMEDIRGNIERLRKVHELGLSIAVDDFGTGYSSLRYLAVLPVQTLKIDQSFVSTMLLEPAIMTLVSTVISLAHSLQLRVVAEGVETEAQAESLRLLGCDEMQGYWFGRPMPRDDLIKRLLESRGERS